MNEDKLQELLKALFEKTITKTSQSIGSFKTEVIDKAGRESVELIVRNFLLDNRDDRLGVLEAKVFVYEQIISKSTFAPMLEAKKASAENKASTEHSAEETT